MSFADNLRAVRKERNISQEELAELLDVTRQAVSKWEQAAGYPEVEKLVTLSKALNVSLDYLFAENASELASSVESKKVEINPETNRIGSIMIKSKDGGIISNCEKVLPSPIFKARKNEPKYALFGVDGVSFWGDNRTFLGWYENEECVTKEVDGIFAALKRGDTFYELQYAAKVTNKFFSIKIVK